MGLESEEKLFEAVLALPPEKRADDLHQTCGSNSQRPQQVEALLQQFGEGGCGVVCMAEQEELHSNQFGSNVRVIPGQTMVIEASTDLASWSALSTNLLGAGPLYFSDSEATNFPARFYRARVWPKVS